MLRGLLCVVWVLACVTAGSADWTHWRGESGNGVSTQANPPVSWSSTENVRWKTPLPGRGSGSPVIWKDQVFAVSAADAGKGNLDFIAFCLDRQSGKILWQKTLTTRPPAGETHSTNNYASASPCTDGEFVFVHFGSQGLYALTMQGELVWKRELGTMVTRGGFGEGSSPTIAGEKLLVPWDHEGQSAFYALDKRTDETIWKVDRDETSNWATPLVVDTPAGQQVITHGETLVRAYDLSDGKLLWWCGGQTQRPVASAVAGDGRVFVGSGFRGAYLVAIDPMGRGDLAGSQHLLWSIDRDTPDIASLLLSENRLYFTKGKSGLLTCVDAATGKPFFQTERIRGLENLYASPIAAGGNVYLTDRGGTTVVIKDAATLEIVSVNNLGEPVDSTPAPSGDALYIRGEQSLFCIGK